MGAGIGKAMGAASDAMKGGQEAIGTVEAAKEGVSEATKGLSSAVRDVSSLDATNWGPALDSMTPEQIAAIQAQETAREGLSLATDQLSGAKENLLAFRTPETVGDAYRQSASIFKPEGFKAAAKSITSPEALDRKSVV